MTIGFHRLLTHRSFATSKPVEYLFAAMGSMSVQGPVISWVSDHRKHHAHADEEGDPHSPHVGGGRACAASSTRTSAGSSASRGSRASASTPPTSWRTPACGASTAPSRGSSSSGSRLPALAGYLITGRITGALTGLLWGGLVRVFFIHHVTWSINSVCHFFGNRRFDIEDHSTNVFWLALPTLGESWHHNHHAFPRSAVHGLGRRELDPSAWVIRAMERVGLVWNVVRIAPERQAQKLIVPGAPVAATEPADDRVATPVG